MGAFSGPEATVALLLTGPQPAQCFGEERTAVALIVTARAELEAIVVPCIFKRICDLLVRERPAAQDDIGVALATLKKHFDGLTLRAADEIGILVAGAYQCADGSPHDFVGSRGGGAAA